MFRQLDDKMLISPQIAPEQVAEAAAQGVTMIVNNRPDGEAPDQPPGSAIAAAAQAAGIAYRHIPVAGGFSPEQVQEMADALAASEGKVLAYCRSGTRSSYLWALARAQEGVPADEIISKAAAAGYDVGALRPYFG
jgi:uncharacterized protein (TIGR01244 family)